MYSIDANTHRHRVTVGFKGEMEQDPEVFFRELSDAVAKVQAGERSWEMLLDLSQTPVMPQDRATNFGKLYHWCGENGLRKAAIVTHMITQRIQLRRISSNDDRIEFFDTSEAAESWLAA